MIEVLIDEEVADQGVPAESCLKPAVAAACREAGFNNTEPDLCLRFSGNDVIRALNKQWRGKDESTDVLSFPMQDGPDYDSDSCLGDIIFSWPYITREAQRLGINPEAHAQHLTIHGVLHLLGFDHITDAEAINMQCRESLAMCALGLHDPYNPGGYGK
ncbi:MAG: rRNA maturation RNase YbeY [Mariprofundaceae bacterium]